MISTIQFCVEDLSIVFNKISVDRNLAKAAFYFGVLKVVFRPKLTKIDILQKTRLLWRKCHSCLLLKLNRIKLCPFFIKIFFIYSIDCEIEGGERTAFFRTLSQNT